GGVGHGFHAAGDIDVSKSGLDADGGFHDGLQPAAAQHVDALGADFHRDACGDADLTADVLAEACGDDVAHEHFVDVFRVDAGLLDGLFEDRGAQIDQLDVGETAHEAADGASLGGYDVRFSHWDDLSFLADFRPSRSVYYTGRRQVNEQGEKSKRLHHFPYNRKARKIVWKIVKKAGEQAESAACERIGKTYFFLC